MYRPTALLLLLSLAVPALAQPPEPEPPAAAQKAEPGFRQPPPTPEQMARAEALFNEALAPVDGDQRQSAVRLEEAVKLNPGEVRYRIALGDACSAPWGPGATAPATGASGDRERGRQVYLEAMKAAPDSPLPHLRLADAYWDEDPVAAAAHLERAAALDPDNALPVYFRALLSFRAGEDDRGRELLLQARERKVVRYPLIMPTVALKMLPAVACTAVQAARIMPWLTRTRELCRHLVRVAGTGPDAATLLIEGQRMGYRVACAEPRTSISLLVGAACDALVGKALEGILLEKGDTTSMARQALLVQRRKAWQGVQEGVRKMSQEMTERLPLQAANPLTRIWVWRDEGESVAKLLADSGLKETIETP